jgi:O-methyltransferase
MGDFKALYLDLMKKSLTGALYEDWGSTMWRPNGLLKTWLARRIIPPHVRMVQPTDPARRAAGRDHPSTAFTMVGLKRLDHLERCVSTVLEEKVPGDLIETGVWRGGSSIFMRAILKANDVTDRRVWVADSFQGFPEPNREKYPDELRKMHDDFDFIKVSLDQVKGNFARFGLLDDQVRFLKGWFKDTLPAAPIQTLALARLDGDLYESTWDGLVNLYPKLAPGGFLIVDDYGAMEVCRKAVQDFRAEHGIVEEIQDIDGIGAFWRRGPASQGGD